MRAGTLTSRITLQQPVETRDAYGGVTRTWSTVGNRWASIQPLSMRELSYAGQTQSRATHAVRMRYDADVRSTWRIALGEVTYEIESVVDVDGSGRELLLQVGEVVT